MGSWGFSLPLVTRPVRLRQLWAPICPVRSRRGSGRRALGGIDSGKCRPLGGQVATSAEGGSRLRPGPGRGAVAPPKGQEKPPGVRQALEQQELGRGQSCRSQGRGEETPLCLSPNQRVSSQRARGLRRSKAGVGDRHTFPQRAPDEHRSASPPFLSS